MDKSVEASVIKNLMYTTPMAVSVLHSLVKQDTGATMSLETFARDFRNIKRRRDDIAEHKATARSGVPYKKFTKLKGE